MTTMFDHTTVDAIQKFLETYLGATQYEKEGILRRAQAVAGLEGHIAEKDLTIVFNFDGDTRAVFLNRVDGEGNLRTNRA